MKIKPKTEYESKSVIHISLHLYTLLPEDIRANNPKKFGKINYEHLRLYWDPSKIPY